MAETVTKTCSKCGEPKARAAFYSMKASRDGIRAWCKSCDKQYAQAWNRANPERWRAAQRRSERKRKYGLTEEAYQHLVDAQGGHCAICDKPPTNRYGFHVDHCHQTGTVRGLLCGPCNTALGSVKENPRTLARMIAYIRRHADS